MLTSIELTGFRGFRQLKLEGLKRVNLIVGKNNSGKTSFLEGVCTVVHSQDSVNLRQKDTSSGDWIASTEATPLKALGKWTDSTNTTSAIPQLDHFDAPYCMVSVIPVFHASPDHLVQVLGRSLLVTGTEERLEDLLRRIDPRIKKLRIDPSVPGNRIVLDVWLNRMVPLSQMGQGVYRLIEVFAEIIAKRPKICLIDEIENGIHHTGLFDLWRGLAEVASLFKVQIFATTHSHECIEAAHEAFSERDSYDFSVIQLFRKSNSEQGRVLHQEHIAAAVAGEIDLRG